MRPTWRKKTLVGKSLPSLLAQVYVWWWLNLGLEDVADIVCFTHFLLVPTCTYRTPVTTCAHL